MTKNDSAHKGKTSRHPAGPAPATREVLKDFLARSVELIEPVLDSLGMELVLARCPIESGLPCLKLFIDRKPAGVAGQAEAAASISLDDCVAVSRAFDEALESDGRPLPEDYALEVSSPGLDRPLTRETDFYRFQGRLVKLKLRQGGRTSGHKGRLALNGDGGLALEIKEDRLDFRFDEVVSCRLSLDEIVF